jgi:hypothetical protein
MAKQSLIWTALPNGYSEDGASLRVSVLLSPRLDAQADPQELKSFFPDWEDWPQTLSTARITVVCGGAPVEIPLTQLTGKHRVDTTLGAPDSAAWKALFRSDLFVQGFVFQDRTNHPIVSYDTVGAVNLVKDLYSTLAASTTGDMPLVSDVIDNPEWRELAGAVASLDRQFVDEKTGLRDPQRQLRAFLDAGRGHSRSTFELLGRLQLFHTPPSTPTVATHSRKDDPRVTATWREHQRTELPKKEDIAKTIDFHQVVAAMNSYPTILRKLGLVVDLLIERTAFPQGPNQLLSASVSFGPAALTVPKSPDASPRTRVRLTADAFDALSNPALASDELRVPGRLLELDPKQFDLLNVDVDGAGLKLMNFGRSLWRMEPDDARVDAVTRFEKEVGAPSLRNAGLMLVHRDRASMLAGRFAASKTKDDAAADVFAGVPGALGPELWAEDVLRGFRIDIWDRTTKRWRSLCERKAMYTLGQGTVSVAVQKEETAIRLATTKSSDPASNQQVVYLHEALVSWTGWSLAVPPPGRAILRNDKVDETTTQTDAEVPPGVPFASAFEPVKGSLPRLRFGRNYWIRARAVDLAGNSLPPFEKDYGPENPERLARPYVRFEPVGAPAVALVRPNGQPTERPAEGESMERIAIRTLNDVFDDPTATTQEGRRFLVPVQASVRDAEHHGKLDVAGKVDATLFDLLANQKDKDASDPTAALQSEKLPMQGPLDPPPPVDTSFAVYRDGEALTYLPDPLAEKVAVRIFDHPNIADSKVITIPLYPSGQWPDAQPFKIRVFEHPTAAPEYKESDRTLHVPLPKAIRARVRISTRVSKAARETMGLWHWLTPAQQQKVDELVLTGQHWMFTPWRVLHVVHAVQRPLLEPELSKLHVDRSFGSTSARLQFHARCSLKSTDRLDLHAEWHEPIDTPEDALSEPALADRSRGDVAFAIKITDPKHYAQKILGQPRGGVPEHTIAGPDLIAVGVIGHDLTLPREHELHDTKYRRIEYWLEGTTTFREYLERGLLVDGSGDPTDEHIKVAGPKLVAWIPSSAPPPAPDVLYVVPTFGWTRATDAQGRQTSWRRGGGLRVYLNRAWHATGYGEMLAVVLPPASFAGDPNTAPASHPYKKFVTQWGNDPLWLAPFVNGIAPTRAHFPLARTGADPAGAWLPAGAPATEADQPPGPFRLDGIAPPGVPVFGSEAAPVEIAPHDVFYDATRRLWYCDIEITQGTTYAPFVRLALARYQPVSINGAYLSPVVLADFMTLTPDRWLTVRHTDDRRRRHVTVFGSRFTDSSGHREAQGGPVAVSPTTVVEVWVEELDPSKGEDFGWSRVPPGAGGPDILLHEPFMQALAAEKPIPQDLVRAKKLVASRNFVEAAKTGVLDSVLGIFRIWDGDVHLPAVPDQDSRYRLVIAEYEEYIVDDVDPYDPPPRKKGRRLVFVEHVEITAAP